MFLKHKSLGDLVEVLTIRELFDPCCGEIEGKFHAGEECQDPTTFEKTELIFPSGEALPQCWLDPDYRHTSVIKRAVLLR